MGSETGTWECPDCQAPMSGLLSCKGDGRCHDCSDTLASLRARLEAAERERDEARGQFKAEREAAAENLRCWNVARVDLEAQRDAALRELEDYQNLQENLPRDLMEWDGDEAPSGIILAGIRSLAGERDAANALLRDICDARYKDELQDEISRIEAHLAASPSPAANSGVADQSLASPEGDGAGRGTICPACSGSGVIEQGWVDGQCQRCSGTGLDARRAQGGDE